MFTTSISPNPPKIPYYHLNLDDVSKILRASEVNKVPIGGQSIMGQGVKVAIVDTGWYQHPYFTKKGWKANVIITTPSNRPPRDPKRDEKGHGTAMAANVLAIAPKAEVTMYKVHSFIESLKAAVQAKPDIISLSKSPTYKELEKDSNYQQLIDLELPPLITQARSNNTIVLVSSGNNGDTPVLIDPAKYPSVIVVGGIYQDPLGKLQVSNYAMANSTKGRLPDICGLCGQKPNGMYIALPTEPNSQDDLEFSQGGDGTKPNDGWLVVSGTSSATPQIAGICALIRQIHNGFTVEDIKNFLRKTAIKVNQGKSFDNEPANPETWSLLADAYNAVVYAHTQTQISKILSQATSTVFPRLEAGFTYSLSDEPILLNGMKVIFDQPVGVYPVNLKSKEEAHHHGT